MSYWGRTPALTGRSRSPLPGRRRRAPGRPIRPEAKVGLWAVIRRVLWAALVLGPLTIALDALASLSDTLLFSLSALSLVPLAWVIGEATERAAHHVGPGIGGFLNATFGNAPELIIALIAISNGLFDVVRGSLIGSVVGNLLLVLGFSLLFGGTGRLDRVSSFMSLGLVGTATVLFFLPAVPSWHGNPNRHAIALLGVPVAIALLALYLVVTTRSLRRHSLLHLSDRHSAMHVSDEPEELRCWSLRLALAVLAAATGVTALVAEVLVHTIDRFADRAHLSEFFVAAVIVAIAGNAAEHGGAVVVAWRGRIRLAAEIALSSSAQVAVFLVPAVALVSWLIKPLALAFRPIEIGALAAAVAVAAATLWPGRSSRLRGALLVAAYVVAAIAFFLAGDR
jgi:Ca2+:H+ antiporter